MMCKLITVFNAVVQKCIFIVPFQPLSNVLDVGAGELLCGTLATQATSRLAGHWNWGTGCDSYLALA
jgi:hypothetical protein